MRVVERCTAGALVPKLVAGALTPRAVTSGPWWLLQVVDVGLDEALDPEEHTAFLRRWNFFRWVGVGVCWC